METKNQTEIQLMKILFKTNGKKATKNVTSQRAYPHKIENQYYRELRGFFKPLTDYVNNYISTHMESILRGDSGEIRLDTIPGQSFRNMIYNLENWLSIYMPDIADLPDEPYQNNNVILTTLGKTADEAMDFGEKEFARILEKGIHVNLPTSAEWWDDMKKSWAEDNYTLITSNAKNYVSKINTLTEQAIVNGISPGKLKDEIMKATEGLSEKHCKLLARDQMGKLYGQISQAQMEEVGLDLYIWSTAYDDRVRDSHALMEGLLCRWDNASLCSYDNGKTWEKRPAGAVELHPGQDIQCRCVPLVFYPELVAEIEEKPMDELTENLPPVQDLPEFEKEKIDWTDEKILKTVNEYVEKSNDIGRNVSEDLSNLINKYGDISGKKKLYRVVSPQELGFEKIKFVKQNVDSLKDKIIKPRGFMSTSKTLEGTQGFLGMRIEIVEIDDRVKGLDLSEISSKKQEAEVLFDKKVHYEIKSAKNIFDEDGDYVTTEIKVKIIP